MSSATQITKMALAGHTLRGRLLFLLFVCSSSVLLNVVLSAIAVHLNGLLFLDTVGTAIAAVAVGPWSGATVGVVTNMVIAEFPCRQQYFNYAVVNAVCGLLWGYSGRVWPKLFVSKGTYARLFFVILALGTLVGAVSAILSLFTTFNFVWRLSDVDPDLFRRWHLTDEYYRWLLKSGELDLHRDTIISVMKRDVIAILPDKIVAISLATLVIYYAIPLRFLVVRGNTPREDVIISRVGLSIFIIIFAFCTEQIAIRGTISIDPSTCTITGRRVIPAQIILWSLPLLLSGLIFASTFYLDGTRFLTGNPVFDPDQFEDKRRKYVQLVYKDVLGILAAIFALLIALKEREGGTVTSAVGEIGALLSNGLGVVAFFGVALFTPGFIFRLFNVGPDVADDD